MLIPSLQNPLPLLYDQPADAIEFGGRKALVETECHWLQPKFADHLLAPNMHVFRLVTVKTVEEKPVGSGHISNCWHDTPKPLLRLESNALRKTAGLLDQTQPIRNCAYTYPNASCASFRTT
jgi:hypothetical protein